MASWLLTGRGQLGTLARGFQRCAANRSFYANRIPILAVSSTNFGSFPASFPDRNYSLIALTSKRGRETHAAEVFAGIGAALAFGIQLAHMDAEAFEVDDTYGWTPWTEQVTGVLFPRNLSGTERLVSAGARFMTPLKVRVYAIGVYVDPVAARIALKKWVGLKSDQLLKEKALWEVMCSTESEFDRTLRMVVVREVDGSHMQNGFTRGLLPRLNRAGKEKGLEGGKGALKKFNKFFLRKGLLKKDCELLFRWSGRGTLDVYIDSKFFGRLESPALCWALWDMFLGEKCVTPHVKSQVAAAIPTFLQ